MGGEGANISFQNAKNAETDPAGVPDMSAGGEAGRGRDGGHGAREEEAARLHHAEWQGYRMTQWSAEYRQRRGAEAFRKRGKGWGACGARLCARMWRSCGRGMAGWLDGVGWGEGAGWQDTGPAQTSMMTREDGRGRRQPHATALLEFMYVWSWSGPAATCESITASPCTTAGRLWGPPPRRPTWRSTGARWNPASEKDRFFTKSVFWGLVPGSLAVVSLNIIRESHIRHANINELRWQTRVCKRETISHSWQNTTRAPAFPRAFQAMCGERGREITQNPEPALPPLHNNAIQTTAPVA